MIFDLRMNRHLNLFFGIKENGGAGGCSGHLDGQPGLYNSKVNAEGPIQVENHGTFNIL